MRGDRVQVKETRGEEMTLEERKERTGAEMIHSN